MNNKRVITEAIVRTEIADMVKEFGKLKKSVENHIEKLVDFYAPFVKNQNNLDEVLEAIRDFIDEARFKDALKIRNVYVSITRPYTQNGKTIVLRTKESRQGECKMEDYYVGRKRIVDCAMGEKSFINRINTKRANAKKGKKK